MKHDTIPVGMVRDYPELVMAGDGVDADGLADHGPVARRCRRKVISGCLMV
jgi:hypothetical protein